MTDAPSNLDTMAALEALADVDAVNAELARKTLCPPHLHAVFGLILGGMVAGQAFPPAGGMGVTVFCLVGLVFLVRNQRRRLGFFVNGYRKGRTRWVALSLLAVVESLLFGSIWLKLHGYPWAPLAAGAAAGVIGFAASYVWQWAYQVDLASTTR